MVKIALDAGHGINTPGKRTPDNEREWTFNSKVLLACAAVLTQYENVQILRLDDPTGNTDVPLITRTNKANQWGADVLVSMHHNADKGIWGSHGGVETYVQEKTASKASMELAALIHPRIVKAMDLRDRGLKTQNLHMTRESDMPAVLTEGGFMDSLTDIPALRSDDKLIAQGEAIAEALAVFFNLKRKIVAYDPNPVKEDAKLKFSSPSLKAETELTLGSKARRQMIVDKAIAAGYSKTWQEKLDNRSITDDDLLALGAGTSVRNSMAKVEDAKAK